MNVTISYETISALNANAGRGITSDVRALLREISEEIPLSARSLGDGDECDFANNLALVEEDPELIWSISEDSYTGLVRIAIRGTYHTNFSSVSTFSGADAQHLRNVAAVINRL